MDLKTMLDEKAEEMRLDPRIPRGLLSRARRRRAANAFLAGTVTVGLALGAFVGARALLDETAVPHPTRPGGTTDEFYPFIHPPTLEELEVTQEQVAQGSMPMWTEPEGAAILFAVNVMGWDMEDVEVDPQDDAVVIRNRSFDGGSLPTTLHLQMVPGSEPPVYAVLAAVSDSIALEPRDADEEFGAGTIALDGRVRHVPPGTTVELTVVWQWTNELGGRMTESSREPVVPDENGRFSFSPIVDDHIGPSTLLSVGLLDTDGRTLALTSSRIATPLAGGSEAGASEPELAIPARVAETRDAILAAAQARDFPALRALIPDEGFTFSFGGETDPITYWKRLESEGHEPVIGDILPMVLDTEPGFDRGVFVWPAQAAEDPAEWDEQDIEALTAIHAEEDVRSFQDAGLYLGWRVGIERDGTWVFFVAGD
ncbi:MAG: hypothetical protein ACRDIZ_01155 [Actinomycetota bacterium]